MPLLRNRVVPLHTVALRNIAKNLDVFWKEEWDLELQEITETSDDILLNLPSVVRLEILLYSSKNGSLNTKALLLLLDHKSLSEDLEDPLRETDRQRLNKILNELDGKYVRKLMARRCKRSTSLSLGYWIGYVLEDFTNLTSLRLHKADCYNVEVIGRSLHNLEQLFLSQYEQPIDSFGTIECLVTGCPKLKILDVRLSLIHHLNCCKVVYPELYVEAPALESVQHVLLGLPNLIEFKHLVMVVALEKIIRDGRADRVSAIRNVYVNESINDIFRATDVFKSAQLVLNHFNNIEKLVIVAPYISRHCKESLKNLSVTVSTMTHLTELSWHEFSYSDTVLPIIEAVGHQLKSLYLSCSNFSNLDVIDQCRKLRVLSIEVMRFRSLSNTDPRYGSDLHEQFTPFQHLEKVHLTKLDHSHFKPVLFKSLIASPVLQDLKLESLHNFTDNIVKSAFIHINDEGEQLAFTSLRKLELVKCDSITNYLQNVVTHERVPLEMLTICECLRLRKKDLWSMQRFDIKFIVDDKNQYLEWDSDANYNLSC